MPLIAWIYLRWYFYGGLRKFCLFLQEWRLGRSRSPEVIDFGTNRKRVCDLLLVRHSNLGNILHRFGDIAAFMCSWPHSYCTLILWVFPLHQIAHVGVNVIMWAMMWADALSYSAVKLFSKNFNLCGQSRYLNLTDGRRDRRLTVAYGRALRSITR